SAVAPIILLKMPPTSFGLALLTSLVGFYSQLSHFCFMTDFSLLLTLLIGLLNLLALLLKEKLSLSLSRSSRDSKNSHQLVHIILNEICISHFIRSIISLILFNNKYSINISSYKSIFLQRQQRRGAREWQECRKESMGNAAKLAIATEEFDEKVRSKYGQWDFEG
ncbi:LOW QUALITY PROTEIN: hypothetical protein CFOL_v3_23400, partial [Cephalotus follicularis]